MRNPALSDTNTATFSPFQRLWLCESIRLHEQHNPLLEDSEACRLARQQGSNLQERIELRNLALARRDGLASALLQWLAATRWLAILLAGMALLTGYGLAGTALSRQATSINVVWALFGLLGLHMATLLFWLAGILYRPGQPSQFIRVPVSLLERMSRSPHAGQLSAALFSLLGRNRLLAAGASRLVHGWWLLTLLTALLVSLVLLGTHRYAFVWETTIASPDSFVALVHALGWPGHWLGFALPDPELIRASGEQPLTDEFSRQSWASWLMGLLVVYGLLPRLALALFCQWSWLRGKAALRLQPQSADWTYLHARLQPASRDSQVIDPRPAQLQAPARAPAGQAGGQSLLLAGLELEQPLNWPATPPGHIGQLGNLDGYADQQALLEQLASLPDAQMILACDARRSPDRGSLHFISELARACSSLHVWLIHGDSDAQRLSGWQQALDTLDVSHGTATPWLDAGARHD